MLRMRPYFSLGTMQGRREWSNIFRVLKEEKSQPKPKIVSLFILLFRLSYFCLSGILCPFEKSLFLL